MPALSRARDNIQTGRKAGRTQMKKLLLIGALAATAVVQVAAERGLFPRQVVRENRTRRRRGRRALRFPELRDLPRLHQRPAAVVCVQNQWTRGNWGIGGDRARIERQPAFR